MNTSDISLFIGKYSFWLAIAIAIGYLGYRLAEYYYAHKIQIHERAKEIQDRFKKKEVKNE